MKADEDRTFQAILNSEGKICKLYNKRCKNDYKTYMHIHTQNRPKDDDGKPIYLKDERIAGYVASDIEMLDVGLHQLLIKLKRTDEHEDICKLFAKATVDDRCPYETECPKSY